MAFLIATGLPAGWWDYLRFSFAPVLKITKTNISLYLKKEVSSFF
jgi:hypothetical protein